VGEEPATAELRAAMVDRLVRRGVIESPALEAAMRAVPRHVFVPAVPLVEAYANDSVITHRDTAGIAISSASQPGIVAGMLELLEVRPRERVLEIGAGTGYNAALLAELAGPDGRVTTVDLDQDIAAAARAHLAVAGFERVRVEAGDGAAGWAAEAPYDKMIVTAGAWDLPPAWWDQIRPGGRLVVPLRLRGFSRAVAFDVSPGAWGHGGFWRGGRMFECGFMPMLGPGAVPEQVITLHDHDGTALVTLRIDDGQPADPGLLDHALAHPPTTVWTDAVVPAADLRDADFWLADLDGICRVLLHGQNARDKGMPESVYNYGSMGLFEKDTFAYIVRRDPIDGAAGMELGAAGYGTRGMDLAQRLAERIRVWYRGLPAIAGVRIDAHPAGSPHDGQAHAVIDKQHTQLRIHATPAT